MAIRKRYTEPLQIVATPMMKAKIQELAEREEISLASVYRRLLRRGLKAEGHGDCP